MKFLKASAAKNKSLKFNKPRVVNSVDDLILAIRSSCVQGKLELVVKNNDPEVLSNLVKTLKDHGYKVKKENSIAYVSWK